MKIDASLEKKLVGRAEADGITRLVAGAAIVRDRKVLLLRRKTGDYMEGIYELPSGVVESGETLGQALSREVLEETGLRIREVEGYLGSFDYLAGGGRPTRQFTFKVSVEPGQDIRLSEHDAFTWAESGELGDIQVSVEVRQLLESLSV